LEKEVDNLIVGGGLAGTWLAFQFLKIGKSFALMDQAGLSISSSVAAGIFNPLLPGRQKKSYLADSIYPKLGKKYQEIETFIDKKVFFELPICYVLEDKKSLNDWSVLAVSPLYSDYVSIHEETLATQIQSEFGHIRIKHSGRVDIVGLLNAFRKNIKAPNQYLEAKFDDTKLDIYPDHFKYEGFKARNLIFCQGVAIKDNKLTEHLQLKPAKGEILLIKTHEQMREDIIPQNGVFMLPMGNSIFKVGSNFEWNELDYRTTEKAREEILRKFTRWYRGGFDIIGHEVGIRPSSMDRRPMIGRLPGHQQENIYIFNGLGSKGVALAPLYSEMLSAHIYGKANIDKDVDVKRMKSVQH
jgi:glycine oxidase